MSQVAVSTSSSLAADAAARIAEEGGNAVDAAVAASLVSAICEPGMVSLAAGGFITIWPESGAPVAIDGGVEMPGRGVESERFGQAAIQVTLDYLGGMRTLVGPGSVAIPGALAAYALASRRHGRLPWRELVAPAAELARDGFPLPPTSHSYLGYSHQAIFGLEAPSHRALHDDQGDLLGVGALIHVEHLGDSLQAIAEEGAACFYHGELAKLMSDHVMGQGGLLSREDLASYEAHEVSPVRFDLADWSLASAPPPSVGGALLGAMIRLGKDFPPNVTWTGQLVAEIVQVQDAVLSYRVNYLDHAEDFDEKSLEFFRRADEGLLRLAGGSPSTVHTSTVDDAGLACSITISAGYGSGVMPPGTGIWLNNCLGELELNQRGFQSAAPGTRLLSNMAPTVGRSASGDVLSIGSPGSSRITSAQMQVLLNHLVLGMSLADAVAHPRLHVIPSPEGPTVAHEPGVPVDGLTALKRPFSHRDVYFGGAAAVRHDRGGRFDCVADPRRSGATAVAGVA